MKKIKLFTVLIAILIAFSSFAVLGVSAEGTVKAGNVNADEQVDILDLVRLKKYLTNVDVKIDFGGADASNDGLVDSLDLVALRKILLEVAPLYDKLIDSPDVMLEF